MERKAILQSVRGILSAKTVIQTAAWRRWKWRLYRTRLPSGAARATPEASCGMQGRTLPRHNQQTGILLRSYECTHPRWLDSVDFAETILQQLHRRNDIGFFNPSGLTNAHVVELGWVIPHRRSRPSPDTALLRAGTGLLSIVLSPFVRHYTVTDIDDLVPLIRKNVTRNLSPSPLHPSVPRTKHVHSPPPLAVNSNVTVTALDWLEIHNAPPSLRARLVPDDPADVLLVVDCIYHPSLIPALLATIDYLTIPGRTTVVVVVELRAEDVIREFLQGWLDKSVDGEWEIWSVNGLLDGPYAVWVGCKNSKKPLES